LIEIKLNNYTVLGSLEMVVFGGELINGIQEVSGSIPLSSTIKKQKAPRETVEPFCVFQ
jgi:hypothetical protein